MRDQRNAVCACRDGSESRPSRLGIGKAAGATLTVIGEEFGRKTIAFSDICDIVATAIIKRRAMDRHFGVAILAEGLIKKLESQEFQELQDVERDDHREHKVRRD